jgi:hypothetical protein
MPRKTVEEKVAEVKRKHAWRLTRQAEKLEAKAAALRKEAAALVADAS